MLSVECVCMCVCVCVVFVCVGGGGWLKKNPGKWEIRVSGMWTIGGKISGEVGDQW